MGGIGTIVSGWLCGCAVTTNHTNEPTGIAVCARHYAQVDARLSIAEQAQQIGALHRDERAREDRHAHHARTIQERLDAAIAAGDVSAAKYYRGLIRLQRQANQAGPESGAAGAAAIDKLDAIVRRMRALAEGKK